MYLFIYVEETIVW